MKFRTTWLLAVFLFQSILAKSQSLSPKVVASAGSTLTTAGGNGNLQFTVGETAVLTLAAPGISYGQGLHNGILQMVDVAPLDWEGWEIKLFPNPTSGILNLEFTAPDASGPLECEVVDEQGRAVFSGLQFVQGAPGTIDATGLAAGAYWLRLADADERATSLKFLKIN